MYRRCRNTCSAGTSHRSTWTSCIRTGVAFSHRASTGTSASPSSTSCCSSCPSSATAASSGFSARNYQNNRVSLTPSPLPAAPPLQTTRNKNQRNLLRFLCPRKTKSGEKFAFTCKLVLADTCACVCVCVCVCMAGKLLLFFGIRGK